MLFTALILASLFGLALYLKKGPPETNQSQQLIFEVELEKDAQLLKNETKPPEPLLSEKNLKSDEGTIVLPEADRIEELFNKVDPKLPIVETIIYKSRVPWQKGRPAWLSDYASHYETSRHFIARSLHSKPDYFKQNVAEGDRFNVFRKDKNFHFQLVIDTSRCKLWFYYRDLDTKENVLLKVYSVSLGRKNEDKASGLLTPLGKYTVGNRVAIYKPKIFGYHKGQKTEMIRIFGTRWIPFDKELAGCTESAKGFGLHGVPWKETGNTLIEDLSSIGKYESDGCIRLSTKDIEEIFSIIITKPAIIELVKDFRLSDIFVN